jgi:hypothetical protein
MPIPSPEQIEQATRILVQLKDYLRDEPPVTDVLPLLTPLLHEDDGVPMLLSDILRASASLVAQQAPLPWSDETGQIVRSFRKGAHDLLDWYVLHCMHLLYAPPFSNPDTSPAR